MKKAISGKFSVNGMGQLIFRTRLKIAARILDFTEYGDFADYFEPRWNYWLKDIIAEIPIPFQFSWENLETEPVFKRIPQIERFRRDLIKASISPSDAAGRKAVFHSLRHTFGTNLARGGVASRVAMSLMRHRDRRLTDKSDTDENLPGT